LKIGTCTCLPLKIRRSWRARDMLPPGMKRPRCQTLWCLPDNRCGGNACRAYYDRAAMRERETDVETEARLANEALNAALRLKKRTARAVEEALRQRAAEELDDGAARSDAAAEALAEEVAKTVAAKDALAVEVARGEADRVAHVNEGDTLKEAVSARLKDLEARAEASKEKAATFMTLQVRGIRKFIEVPLELQERVDDLLDRVNVKTPGRDGESEGVFRVIGDRNEIILEPHPTWPQPHDRRTTRFPLKTKEHDGPQRSCHRATGVLKEPDKKTLEELTALVAVAVAALAADLGLGPDQYYVHEYALIHGAAQKKQPPHCDSRPGEVQVAVMIGPTGEPTLVYQGDKQVTPEQLAELCPGKTETELLGSRDLRFTTCMRQLTLSRAEIVKNLVAPKGMPLMDRGDAVAIGGGVPHCGPFSEYVRRALLFLVITPKCHYEPYATVQFWPCDVEIAFALTAEGEERRKATLEKAVASVRDWADILEANDEDNRPHKRATEPFKHIVDKDWLKEVSNKLKDTLDGIIKEKKMNKQAPARAATKNKQQDSSPSSYKKKPKKKK
jgi:hypothetical protein